MPQSTPTPPLPPEQTNTHTHTHTQFVSPVIIGLLLALLPQCITEHTCVSAAQHNHTHAHTHAHTLRELTITPARCASQPPFSAVRWGKRGVPHPTVLPLSRCLRSSLLMKNIRRAASSRPFLWSQCTIFVRKTIAATIQQHNSLLCQ